MNSKLAQPLTERICYIDEYSSKEKDEMNAAKSMIKEEINYKNISGKSQIYPNQHACSSLIVAKLHDKKIITIVVVALTQSGKTGTMIGLIRNYMNDIETFIKLENIFIITGLSSREWVKQMLERMPASIQCRVYHRNKLRDFVSHIKNKKNVLVIIDEIQIAAKEHQTVHNAFKEAGFYDKQYLLKNDIKIVEFSATPDGAMYDIMNWGDHSFKIKMPPGDRYTSCFDLKNQGRVFQYGDLCGYDNKKKTVDYGAIEIQFKELKQVIDNFNNPLYHVIRIPNSTNGKHVIDNFKYFIGKDIQYDEYDKDSDIDDINSLLKTKPENHKFIFIKEKLRCSKTLTKEYLGVLYERYTKIPNDSVIIQGLIGRMTGYDDNGISICFTNIESIEKYEKLWNSNFEDREVEWISHTTTKSKNKLLTSRGTYNNPKLIDGMIVESEPDEDKAEPIIQKFKTQQEAKEYFNRELNPRFGGQCRGPQKRRPNPDGFYETIIGNGPNKKRARTTDEIYEVRNFWLGTQNKPYRFYPCYRDLQDKSTLEFWLIHKILT